MKLQKLKYSIIKTSENNFNFLTIKGVKFSSGKIKRELQNIDMIMCIPLPSMKMILLRLFEFVKICSEFKVINKPGQMNCVCIQGQCLLLLCPQFQILATWKIHVLYVNSRTLVSGNNYRLQVLVKNLSYICVHNSKSQQLC